MFSPLWVFRSHAGVREDGMMMLEGLSWFVPMGWVTKIRFLKPAIALFKLKRGAAAGKIAAKTTGRIADFIIGEAPLTAKQLATGNCRQVATALQTEFGGEILQITSKYTPLIEAIHPITGEAIGGWSWHMANIRNGIVYDGLTGLKGMALEQYKQLFTGGAAENLFEKVAAATLK